MAKIVDYGASLYPEYDDLIPALSGVFLGIEESNPLTIVHAAGADPCAAVGREPKDCGANAADNVFWDRGFNSDFQDRHSQAFHLWAYLATTASTDIPGGYFPGLYVGKAANFGHEVLGIGDRSGASWQDFALSEEAIRIGAMIAFGLVEPARLGDYIRDHVGSNSFGAPYVGPLIRFFPLWGNR